MRARTALAGTVLLLLAGCGSADDDPGGATPTVEETAGSGDDAMAATSVMVAASTLGDVLVDGEGLTLYMFDPDAQGASTCYDDCATAWPPLVTDGTPGAGDGADDSLLGTVERDDGAVQVTYDGWPLYYFAQDAAPGDVKGQGLNDVWWVLDADGEPVH
ncbi:hypothetical protein [Cellulomonas sp. KRMCY2]|uniref:COG4315 family predicted lipoprotein n=1 Tax=Cellulomonas sp. KRMCY2 TaxID=1304865 RepID=UPI00045E6909|nr:hypothetical protein [Cellulomonas sp. KRMCY2]